nr:MAG TPA: hypothetical protein [Caudoviricetes sp.]
MGAEVFLLRGRSPASARSGRRRWSRIPLRLRAPASP